MIRAEINNTVLRLFSSAEEAQSTGDLITQGNNYRVRYWQVGYFVETNQGFYDYNGYFDRHVSDEDLLYLSEHSTII